MTPKSKKPPSSRKSPALPLPAPAILGEMSGGVIVFDRAGQPVYVNAAALHLLGWDAATPESSPLTLGDLAALGELYASAAEADGSGPVAHLTWTEEHTWVVRRPDGTQLAIGVLPAPLRDPASGEIVGAVHSLHSVAEWYEQNATKEEFLSIASHELRAPLQPLILASRFIQRWIDRPDHRVELATLADQIVQQSKRLSQLVLDMINMTRINSGVFVVEREAIDVAKIVRDVVAEQRTVTRREVVLIGAESPIRTLADDEKLWQAFTNLISNAIKYSPAPAPVTVTLSHFTAADATPWLRVAVRDEGNGIAPEQVGRVFDRFYRASVSKGMERQQQDGLGLGLYITRAIVEGHGGHIAATSVVGTGSTFTIELPLG